MENENFYVSRKQSLQTHAQRRYSQRYGEFSQDVIDAIKTCIKCDMNIVHVKSQSGTRNKYIIMYEHFYSLIWDKGMDEIVTFLPITREDNREIDKFKKAKIRQIREGIGSYFHSPKRLGK